MSFHSKDIHQLFARFLEVCNKAIAAHKDEFPYKYIWEAAENMQSSEGLHVTVYDGRPKVDYTLRLKNKRIKVTEESVNPSVVGWRINTSYMKEVVENPDWYIDQPARLDWHWLKNRVGMD